ncbi:MAG: hypothetical protein LBG95_05240 [Treponema sp.]|jgi:hypothetical protein|nr:hypothetical protein [Treponema sp.]
MTNKEIFMERAKNNLITALSEFQNGKMDCEGLVCSECCFYSGSNPAGSRCEIVNIELKICCLLKASEKEGYK